MVLVCTERGYRQLHHRSLVNTCIVAHISYASQHLRAHLNTPSNARILPFLCGHVTRTPACFRLLRLLCTRLFVSHAYINLERVAYVPPRWHVTTCGSLIGPSWNAALVPTVSCTRARMPPRGSGWR